ncbi:MAG: hypothetical protein Q9220_002706 [cf. Caloplaca sp. 1 TL-2023]
MEEVTDIDFPTGKILKPIAVQTWLYNRMFSKACVPSLPTARYTFRVLKKLVNILEATMEDPEEDVSGVRISSKIDSEKSLLRARMSADVDGFSSQEISDDLTACLSSLLTQQMRDEMSSAQELRPVTYTAPARDENAPMVTMSEAPSLLSSNGDSGFRTWAAALFLATYLYGDGRCLVENKNIIELGAGLGFLSILCAKHLGAKHVLTTDGSEPVVDMAKENITMNGVNGVVDTAVLKWGSPIPDNLLHVEEDFTPYDLVLGADMVYEPRDFPALMSTLQELFSRFPNLQVLISSAVRREATLDSFLGACRHSGFEVELLNVNPVPENEQLGFFHSTFEPIHIYFITKPGQQGQMITEAAKSPSMTTRLLQSPEAESFIEQGSRAVTCLFTNLDMSGFLEYVAQNPGTGMFPTQHHGIPYPGDLDMLHAQMKDTADRWLAKQNLPSSIGVYFKLREVSMPEFGNVRGEYGVWRVPAVPNRIDETGTIAVMMTRIDKRFSVVAIGVEEYVGGARDWFLAGRLTDIEIRDISRGIFPRTLEVLGKPGVGVCGQTPSPISRMMAGMDPPTAETHGFHGADPTFATRSTHRHPSDRQYQHGTFNPGAYGMDSRQSQRGLPMRGFPPKPTPGLMARPTARPRGQGGYVAPPKSLSTSSDSDSSSPERAPKKKKKAAKSKKTTKKPARGRSSSEDEENSADEHRPQPSKKKPALKPAPRRRARSDNEDDDAEAAPPPRRATVSSMRPPISKPAPRRRGRSDDEDKEEEAAPPPRRATDSTLTPPVPKPALKPAPRRRGRSDDEDEEEEAVAPPPRRAADPSKAQRPAPKSVVRRGQDRDSSEDEGPPPMDPVEQARLVALKAKNGYGDKPEKSGWH